METVSSALIRREGQHAYRLRLTPRQQEILLLIAEGLTTKVIAARLGVSDRTVKNHINAIYHVLDVDNRVQAAMWAVKHGLKTP